MTTLDIREMAEKAEATLWDYSPMLANMKDKPYYREEIEFVLNCLVSDAAHLLAQLGETDPVGRLSHRLVTALDSNYEAEVNGE